MAIASASSTFTTTQSPCPWLAKMRALAAAYARNPGAGKVVRREVEQHRNPGTEGNGRLQLEAADFHHVDRFPGRTDGFGAQAAADVAAHPGRKTCRLKHPPDDRCRRRLALRPRDGDDAARQRAPGEFDLADHRNAAPGRGPNGGLIDGDAGAEHDEVGGCQRFRTVATQLELDAKPAKRFLIGHLRGRIGEDHAGAVLHEQRAGAASAAGLSRQLPRRAFRDSWIRHPCSPAAPLPSSALQPLDNDFRS